MVVQGILFLGVDTMRVLGNDSAGEAERCLASVPGSMMT